MDDDDETKHGHDDADDENDENVEDGALDTSGSGVLEPTVS
jgi:hypothetical protein